MGNGRFDGRNRRWVGESDYFSIGITDVKLEKRSSTGKVFYWKETGENFWD